MKSKTYYVQMKTGPSPNDVWNVPHTKEQCEHPVHGKAQQHLNKVKAANPENKFRIVEKVVIQRFEKWQ